MGIPVDHVTKSLEAQQHNPNLLLVYQQLLSIKGDAFPDCYPSYMIKTTQNALCFLSRCSGKVISVVINLEGDHVTNVCTHPPYVEPLELQTAVKEFDLAPVLAHIWESVG